jgi:5-methylthioadenosine/S-adenosylhomocysteine deaminase
LSQRHASGDPTVLPGAEALEIATGAKAPLLAGGTKPLTRGVPADFLLLRCNSPELGVGELASNLVYAATGSAVDTTVVAGRVLMRDGEVEGIAEIVARAAERARRLGIC